MTFTIYDYRGNVVYNEYVEEADRITFKESRLQDGWVGMVHHTTYTAYGVLLDETKLKEWVQLWCNER